MIKNNKLKTLISSIIILLPTLFGLAVWNKLPDEIISHIGLDGTPDSMANKATLVFGIPALFLMLQLFFLWLSDKDPGHKKQPEKVLGMVFWILPAASYYCVILMVIFSFSPAFYIH